MLSAVLGPPSNVCLQNMTAIEERHLSVGLDPDLVRSMLRENWQSSNMQTEFGGLGEFACRLLVQIPDSL